MSETEKTVAVDPNAKPVTTKAIQTEEAAKAEAAFLEVARNINATVENKFDALLALKGAADRRPVVDDRPKFDDVDVRMSRSIRDLYDSDLSQSELGQRILKVGNRLYLEHQILNGFAKRANRPFVPINKGRLAPLYADVLVAAGILGKREDFTGAQIDDDRTVRRADIWNTATSNEGQEWAPIGVSTQRIDLARIQARVPALFPQVPIRQMRSMYVPTIAGAAAVRVMSQFAGTTAPQYPGTQTPNNPTIGQMQITPIKHATDPAFINMEMLEDSPTAVLEGLQMEVAQALAHGWESAILNGQTTADAANLDGANGPVAAAGSYNAIRYYGVVTNANTRDAGGGACGYDDWAAALASMGIFGLKNSNNQQGNTVAILSPKCIFDITADSPGGINNLVGSYAFFGPGNPLPVGTVTMLNGVPIIPTMNWPAMLATGKVGASSNNFTGGAIVDVTRWKVGVAREIEVKTVPFELDDAIGVRGFSRHGLGSAPPTTDKHVAIIRNVAA